MIRPIYPARLNRADSAVSEGDPKNSQMHSGAKSGTSDGQQICLAYRPNDYPFLPGLLAAISRPGMNEVWLAGVSVAVLLTLLALQMALAVHTAYNSQHSLTPAFRSTLHIRGPLAAATAVCFFIYTAYALLPIRLRHACIAAFGLSIAHIVGCFLFYSREFPDMMKHVSSGH